MNFQFINTSRKQHNYIQGLLAKKLQKLGHTTITPSPDKIISSDVVDATISSMPTCFESYQPTFKNPAKPWLRTEHGIYFYKQWARWVCYDFYDLFLMPTQYPVDFYYSNYKYFSKTWRPHTLNHVTFKVVDGWGKLDLYYQFNKNRDTVRKEIFERFDLDILKPLVLYVPTWIRDNGSKEEWISTGMEADAYVQQGSGYLHPQVKQAMDSLPINFFPLHHYVTSADFTFKDLDTITRVKLMVASDLLIGDVSSMVGEYTTLDKPIVLLRKKEIDRDPYDFNVYQDEHTTLLDIGHIVDISELSQTVDYALSHDDYTDKRKYWRNLLVIPDGKFDGKCTEREATAIVKFVKSYKETHE